MMTEFFNSFAGIIVLLALVAWMLPHLVRAVTVKTITVSRSTDNDENIVVNMNVTIFDTKKSVKAKLAQAYGIGSDRRKQRFDEFQDIIASEQAAKKHLKEAGT